MGRAKEIIVKVIPAKIANEFVRKWHYSGKSAINAYLHFGAFLDGRLHGVLQFGPPLQKSNLLSLIENAKWNDFVELNRMAFDDYLPKNSESRCLSISIKLIKKNTPQIKWLVSFADSTQSGDGAIYRASGFLLTSIKENTTLYQLPNGFIFADIGLRASSYKLREKVNYKVGELFSSFKKRVGAVKLKGFQLRYIYLIDKSCKITVPILPFSKIDEMGAGMYKGKKITVKERQLAAVAHSGEQPASSREGAFDATVPLNIQANGL
jgi:hypothetical protein